MSPESWFQEEDAALGTIQSRKHPTPTRIGWRASEAGSVTGRPRLRVETRKNVACSGSSSSSFSPYSSSICRTGTGLPPFGQAVKIQIFRANYELVEVWMLSRGTAKNFSVSYADLWIVWTACPLNAQKSVSDRRLRPPLVLRSFIAAALGTLTAKTPIPTSLAARPLGAARHLWRSRHGYGVCGSLRNAVCVSTCS